MREQVNVPAGPMHSSEVCLPTRCPRVTTLPSADICTESISPFSSELRMAHIYHDARVLYPAKGIRHTGMARRVRRNHLGIFVLFLHSDSCRTYLEIYYFSLYSTYDSRYSTCLPKYLLGGIITALFMAMQILSNHVQMTYYFLFVILFMVGAFFEDAWRKRTPQFFKATGVLIVAGLIGYPSTSQTYTTLTNIVKKRCVVKVN